MDLYKKYLHEMLKGEKAKAVDIGFYEHISRVKKEARQWLEGIEKNGIDHSVKIRRKPQFAYSG